MADWVTREESISKYGTEAYTGWGKVEAEADFKAKGSVKGTQGAGAGTTSDFIKALVDPILEELGAFEQRVEEFGLEGPFAFDEALAREASREIVDPYYDQLLSEFTQGIEMRRRQGAEEERDLLKQLTTEREYETGTLRQRIEDAIMTTEQGYETRGLYASGVRRREAGRQEALGQVGLRRAEEVFGERETAVQRQQRQLAERLGLTQKVGERELLTGRLEATEAGVEARRAEQAQQTEIERLQTTALPFVTRSEEALQRLLQFS